MKHILGFLFFLFILSIPSNLFFRLNDSWGYLNGIFIDYRIPKLYLSDVTFLTFVAVYFIYLFFKYLFRNQPKFSIKKLKITVKKWLQKNARKIIIFSSILALAITLQLTTKNPKIGIVFILRLVQAFFLSALLINLLKNKMWLAWLNWGIISVLIFQTFLSLYQNFRQHSLLPYQFLGESNLSASTGISTFSFFGSEKILPSGTLPHPNILAGIMLLLLITFFTLKPTSKFQKIIAFLLAAITILLTHSLSAILGLLIFLVFWFSKQFTISQNKISYLSIGNFWIGTFIFLTSLPLLLEKFTSNPSITRRAELIYHSLNYFFIHTLNGVGLNQSTEIMVGVYTADFVRFVQPVHNVGILMLTEMGAILSGVIIVSCSYFVFKNWKSPKFKSALKRFLFLSAPIIPLLALDHYLWSNQSSRLILAIFVAVAIMDSVKELPPQPAKEQE